MKHRTLYEITRDAILESLERHNGCKTKVAEELGISITTVRSKLQWYAYRGEWNPRKEWR